MKENTAKKEAGWVKWEVLLLLWMAYLLNQGDRQVFNTVLPSIREALGLTDSDIAIKNMDQAQALAAFENNIGDGVGLWAPHMFVAMNKGAVIAADMKMLGKGNPNPRIDDFLGSGVLIATGSRAIECSLPNHPPRDALKARHSGLTKEEMLVDVIVRDCRKDENHAF